MVKKQYFCDICGKEVEEALDLCAVSPTISIPTTKCFDSCHDCIREMNKAIDEKISELSHGNLTIGRI